MFPSAVGRTVVLLFCLPLSIGCAAQSEDLAKQLREASDRLHRVESRSDRLEERVSALEMVQRSQANRPASEDRSSGVPSDLPVVKVGPARGSSSFDGNDSSAESDEPRTLIVGEGARVESKTVSEPSSGVTAKPASASKRARDKGTIDPAKKANSSMDNGTAAP